MDDRDPNKPFSFRDFLKQTLRSSRFSWGAGDVEHLPRQDRKDHFSWNKRDVEHLSTKKVDEDVSAHLLNMSPTVHRIDHNHQTDIPDEEIHNQIRHRNLYTGPMHDAHFAYKVSSFGINNYLRNGVQDPHKDYDKHNEHLEKITSNRTVAPFSAYRGFGIGFPIHHLEPGHEFLDKGYTGLSRRLTVAGGGSFLHASHSEHADLGAPRDIQSVPDDHPLANHYTIAHVSVPAGTKGHLLDMPEHFPTTNSREGEFLLHRGTRFRVLGHSKGVVNTALWPPVPRNALTSNVHLVHLQVVGQGTGSSYQRLG